uniref:Uncharacterized protein n=1 Tax=Arundo donax TaxID=35708 RepID=A0A0A9HH60_ARUDO
MQVSISVQEFFDCMIEIYPANTNVQSYKWRNSTVASVNSYGTTDVTSE